MNSSRFAKTWRLLSTTLAVTALSVAALPSCGDDESKNDEAGSVILALMQVPADVSCIRVTATGTRTVIRTFSVTPGQATTFQMNALPVGTVDFLGEAFTQACNALGPSSVAPWISDHVSATLTAGTVAQVTLIMRRNGRATVGIDFQDEPMCRAAAVPCMLDAECCAGLACVALPDGQRACAAPSLPPQLLLFAALVVDLGGVSPNPSSLEIVDLDTRMRVRTLDLGSRTVSSIAVSPDGARAYIGDANRALVSVINTTTGANIADIAVTFPRDIVLSADGARLFATTGNSFTAIDTATNTVVSTLSTGSDTPLGLTLSPDGTMLGAPSTVGGSNTAYYLVNATVPLLLLQRITVGNPRAGCTSFPNDTVFTNTGRALMWDSSCDAIYQVDVALRAILPAATIAFTRDSGSLFNFNNVLAFSAPAGRAFVVKDSSEVAIGDPAAVSGTTLGGFTGVPFVLAQTPSADAELVAVIHRFGGGGGGPDTLDRLDAATQTFQRGIYTFSDAGKSARDMRIVVVPR
jgi:YVTN family beta-propeller protein